MINSRVELLFKNLPDKYPFHLERNYIRILNRLMQLWDLPEFDPYMHGLLIDKRSDRQGFPPEVVDELMFLGELHDLFKSKEYRLPELHDLWKDIPVRNPTPQGFRNAIELGQLDVIETFLGAGVKADYRFEGAQTPLMVAVASGQLGAVHCLIENGAGVNLRDENEYTALHWAAFYGRPEIVEGLVDADAEINVTQNRGVAPVELAMKRGHQHVARLLMKCRAAQDITGNYAVSDHDFPVGSMPGKESSKNEPINSATGSHSSRSDISPIAAQQKDADQNKSTHFLNLSPERIVLLSIASLIVLVILLVVLCLGEYQSYQKRTASALSQSQPVDASPLVLPPPVIPAPETQDIGSQQPGQIDNPPKSHVARHKAPRTHTVVNPAVAYTFDDLMEAVGHSNINLVDRLLEQGMDINRRDGAGLTPLIVAVENNDLNMAKHLIEKGADPNIPRQHDGYTPIVVAKTAAKPNAELIELLRASGAHNPFN